MSEKSKGPEGGAQRPRLMYVLIALVGMTSLLFLFLTWSESSAEQELTFNEFDRLLKIGAVERIELPQGDEKRARVQLRPGGELAKLKPGLERTVMFGTDGAVDELRATILELEQGAPKVETELKVVSTGVLLPVLINLFPWVIFIGLLLLLMRQVRGSSGAGGILSFGKSRARLANKEVSKVTFRDVAGIDEAKEEVEEIVQFLKNPEKFRRLGGRIPRGVLLAGLPGTGKTLLAKAIAGEADVPFLSISGSDFVEMFVGVGASRVRDLFKQAKKNAPCILFLDEIDAVGRKRGAGFAGGGGGEEREQTLNAILVEMDGFETDDNVIVLAATNRADILDPALMRPGRFDRQVAVDLPDVVGREAILRVHVRKIRIDPDVDLKVLARSTPTFSGAELAAMCNEAAILAAVKGRDAVVLEDLEEARDKIRFGRRKKKSHLQTDDKLITAYHESGHAIVAALLDEVNQLHKVTIIPRGQALGVTIQMPERDRYHMQKNNLLQRITVCYGGRVAEELACNDISAGAQNDIEKATQLARKMVTEWGMSSLGLINLSPYPIGEEPGPWSKKPFSEKTARSIDDEVFRILDECYQRCKTILIEHRDALEAVTKELMKHETLSGKEVLDIMSEAGSALPQRT